MSVAATQRERGVRGRPRRARRRARASRVEAGGRQRLGQPPRLRHAELLQPRRAARPRRRRRRARPSAVRAGRARHRLPLQRDAAARPSSRSIPDSTKRPIVELTTSSASAICAAARRAAAAGLLSSWASPAAIVPSAARRSRFCSMRGDAAHHGRDLAHHALVHRRLRERQPAEVARRRSSAMRHGVSRAHPHAERAARQHGDRAASRSAPCCRPTGSARPSLEDQGQHRALEQQHQRRRAARPARR